MRRRVCRVLWRRRPKRQPQSGAGSGAASTPGSSGTEPAWYGSVDADTESYIKNKGWKGPGDLLKSYTNLERLRGVGADKLLKLPDFNNADEANAFYERIGVPKAPTDYKAPGEPRVRPGHQRPGQHLARSQADPGPARDRREDGS